jgi:hypothetical protein
LRDAEIENEAPLLAGNDTNRTGQLHTAAAQQLSHSISFTAASSDILLNNSVTYYLIERRNENV